jgi:CubicO group peptidase (beta-lactamase class C family)
MKLKLKYAVTTLFMGLVFCVCQGQMSAKNDATDTMFKNKMDLFIDRVIDSLNIKFGIGMAVVKDEDLVYEGYYGTANYEKNIPVTPQTNFYIASSTKSFTALAMLILHSKGVIDLDASLASYFPESKFKPKLNADKVNLRDLLYHTSGLENNNITFSKAYTGIYTLESLTQNLIDYTIPNTRADYGEFKYSNLGYNIIEIILERELGKTWKEVVQEEVLNPLGMTKTSSNISDITRLKWSLAEPYTDINIHGDLKGISLKKKDSIMHAAGGLISTPRDMAKFLIAELNDGKLNGEQVFPKGMIPFSQKPQAKQERNFLNLKRFGYGYGWNIATTPLGDTLVHHYGGFPGTAAQVSFMPEHNVGLSIYANDSMKGLMSTFLIASYAFDYYAGREDLEAYYDEQLAVLKSRMLSGYKGQKESLAKRAERTWQLELPFEAYAGSYYSPSTGTLVIDCNEQNQLIASMGYLRSEPATPFTSENSMRVELIPGSGNVMQFYIENGEVAAIGFDGLRYNKTK